MHFDTFTEGIDHKMNLEAQPHHESGRLGNAECPTNPVSYTMDDHLQSYWCQELHKVNGTTVDGEYNEGIVLSLSVYEYQPNYVLLSLFLDLKQVLNLKK